MTMNLSVSNNIAHNILHWEKKTMLPYVAFVVSQWLKWRFISHSIYILSVYKMTYSVAHLTQNCLKPFTQSRGVYAVSQYGVSQRAKFITQRSHGEKIWQNIDETMASLWAWFAQGYDRRSLKKRRWLKGGYALWRTEQSSAGRFAVPQRRREPRVQRANVSH